MSYEGYEIIYCKNGHLIEHRDAMASYFADEEYNPTCSICGEKGIYHDCVDETNGCECGYLAPGEVCYCHPKDIPLLRFDPFSCSACKGTGVVTVAKKYVPAPCKCPADPVCSDCHGTGQVLVPDVTSIVEVACLRCEGSGKQYHEVFDMTDFNKRPRKKDF